MTEIVNENLKRTKISALIFPTMVLVGIGAFLLSQGALFSAEKYVFLQKEVFFCLNQWLSQTPEIQYNLTQLGDAFVVYCLLSVLYFRFPKIWEALIAAGLFSLIASQGLKHLIDVPRPAEIFNSETFNIIGEEIVGYSSMPSGHSITIFTALSVLAIAFQPKQANQLYKTLYYIGIVFLGIFLCFTRVGVGAHHPLDTLVGGAIGGWCGILGILLIKKYNALGWIRFKPSQFFFALLFLGRAIFMITYKIPQENLPIFYLSLGSLLVAIYFIVKNILQKQTK